MKKVLNPRQIWHVKFTFSIRYDSIIRKMLVMCFIMSVSVVHSQKVAVVLSGGGATAMAHVGFLKVLEENNVPIDYICGTSMGAVIGAMYASGYSASTIDSIVRTKEFLNMAMGDRNDELDEPRVNKPQ